MSKRPSGKVQKQEAPILTHEEQLRQLQEQQDQQQQQRLYQQIVNDEKKVYGKKYPLRNTEPSMFDMLKWQGDASQADQTKVQKSDYKIKHIPQSEIEQYRGLINKSSETYQTEQRDNYRQFYLDKQENVLLPEVDPEVLVRLKSPNKAGHSENVNTTNGKKQGSAQQQAQPSQQQLENAQIRGFKSNYQLDYGVQEVRSTNELIGIVNKNHVASQKPSQQLLEEAHKKKWADPSRAQLYEYEREEDNENNQNIINDNDDAEWEGDEDENRGGASSKKQKPSYAQPPNRSVKAYKKVDTKNVKSKLIKYKPQAAKLDPEYQSERINRRKDRIKHMEETTRWMPNTAFTTYFAKPAFENYGRGNVNPANGGCVYGQYMLSHNVNPHRGVHQPKFIQSYNNALNFGERLPQAEPQPPRNVKEDFRLSQNQVEELKSRNPLTGTKNNRSNLVIQKPDLVNSLRFASNENSPVNTAKETDEQKRKRILNELKELKEGTKAHTGTKSYNSLPTQEDNARPQTAHPTFAAAAAAGGAQPNTKHVRIGGAVVTSTNEDFEDEELDQAKAQANREWAADLPRKKFIEELAKKKAKKNRLALKVTEVVPAAVAVQPKDIAGISSAKKNAIPQVNKPLSTSELISATSGNFDLSGVTTDAQSELREKLQNPKLYKNAPSVFTRSIPYAGKTSNPNAGISDVFKYQNSDTIDFYY